MRQLINSPLKILGLLTILLGLTTGILTYGYLLVLGLIFIGTGLLLYAIDFLARRNLKNRIHFRTVQLFFSIAYLIFAFVTYMRWQEHNYIVFQNDFKGDAGIVFGIEGYPELPQTSFWKKTINVPSNGLIITSTKVEDIPNKVVFAFNDGSRILYDSITWDPNFGIDCIISEAKIVSWVFRLGDVNSDKVNDKMTELCNLIAAAKVKSKYKSEYSAIVEDKKGKYLSLQGNQLSSLPDGLGKLNIYRAVLTENEFDSLPKEILDISSLEDLIFAVNPISEFPCEIGRLKNLKSVSFAATKIKEIECDLSALDSLQHFDLARNDLSVFPEKIKTIPNLTWLSLNDNQFSNISFIDSKLEKLQTLYLYSNQIRSLSKETRHLKNLQELLIFDNEIDSIPDNISDLTNLEKLEIWNNPIKFISPQIGKLTKLRSMRLDDDNLTSTDKDILRKMLPNCEINFQTRSEKKNAL